MTKIKKLSFEDRMKRLEEIQEKMNSSELTLEQNTKYFQESQEHIKFCKNLLDKTELKIKKIVDGKKVNFEK